MMWLLLNPHSGLEFRDTAGQERFVKGVESALGTAFYMGASGALLVCKQT